MSNLSKLNEFMKDHFNNLLLVPPLFYSSKYGLRFEISDPDLAFQDKANLQQVYDRSIAIFNKAFDVDDNLLLVTNVYSNKEDTFLRKKPLNVYRKYVKNKQSLTKLSHHILSNIVFDEEEDSQDKVIHRFIFPCKKNEIHYSKLLLAIGYEDFGHQSCILKGYPRNGYDIFFVNLSKRIIYHLYDDRGCDVIASDKEAIRFLYEENYNWILDYDRKEIDNTFIN